MRDPIPNLADDFFSHARATPEKLAVRLPKTMARPSIAGGSCAVSFTQMRDAVLRFSAWLGREDFRPGDRIVIFLPVSGELYALLLAIFRRGVVPVFIDPSMGLRRVLYALDVSGATALISNRAALRLRYAIPALWKFKLYAADGGGPWLRPVILDSAPGADPEPGVRRAAEDHALITYTSGSTGRPKGADRNVGVLHAQHRISRDLWPSREDEVDMPCFPMVGLQNLSCGITTVLPEIDFRDLEKVDGRALARQIRESGVTRFSAPPSILKKISDALLRDGETLPQIRSLVTGGAPVPTWLCRRTLAAFPGSESIIVYGSTEAEPMAFVTLQERADVGESAKGYLVGRAIAGIRLEVARLPARLSAFDERGGAPYLVPDGEVGEVIVRGPHVVPRYLNHDDANAETKIADAGEVWHRTGDLAFRDGQSRFWLVGRASDVIRIHRIHRIPGREIAPFPLEHALEEMPGIARAAMVQRNPSARPLLALELRAGAFDPDRAKGVAAEHLGSTQFDTRIFSKLPVDRRHFWKIDRVALRKLRT